MTATMETTTPAAITWDQLVQVNSSLDSWAKSAASAGAQGIKWWLPWAEQSQALRNDLNHSLAFDFTHREYADAKGIIVARLTRIFDRAQHNAESARLARRKGRL